MTMMQSFRDGHHGAWSDARRLALAAWGVLERLVAIGCTLHSLVLAYQDEWGKATWFAAYAILIAVYRLSRNAVGES